MLTVIDGEAATTRTVSSLRAACEALRSAADGINAVTVSGSVAEPSGSSVALLSAAQRLAAEYGFAVTMSMDGAAFAVRFSRRSADPPAGRLQAG